MRSLFITLIFSLLLAGTAGAQGLNPVRFTARTEPARLGVGQSGRVIVTATIEPGWHLYSLTQPPGGPRPTRITIDDGAPLSLVGTPRQPKPRVAPDPNFSVPGEAPFMTETFEKQVDFTLDVKVSESAPTGPLKMAVKVYFQACDDHQCLPPRTRPVDLETTLIAAAGGAKADPLIAVLTATPSPSPTATPALPPPTGAAPESQTGAEPVAAATAQPAGPSGESDPRNRGLLGYILFAMSVGLLSLLTPCVFPMIPITVSYFTKQQERGAGDGIRQALIYCLGIILTFTGLGLAMTLIAGPSGINRLAASPWVNLLLTTLFAVFALNLFGLFEIRLPTGLLNRLDAQSRTGTTAATLLMGLTFTLTSFTCTAAFVGTVLVAVTQGDWFWPTAGMLAFSTAFALPFFFLALFPRYLQSLPRSGGWMNSVKVVMGFLELGAAFKFLSNVDLVWGWNTISRSLVLAAWIAISIVTALYLLGKFMLPHDSEVKRIGVPRMLLATLFLALAFWFVTGLFGASLGEWEAMLPPAPKNAASLTGPSGGQPSGGGEWLESYDEALATARREQKPVFLNFTGVTCTNCRWMESNMFPDPEVRRLLADFVRAELYTDRDTPSDEANSRLQAEMFQTVALPLYAIVDPSGNILAKFPGLTRNRNEFIGFLAQGRGKSPQ